MLSEAGHWLNVEQNRLQSEGLQASAQSVGMIQGIFSVGIDLGLEGQLP